MLVYVIEIKNCQWTTSSNSYIKETSYSIWKISQMKCSFTDKAVKTWSSLKMTSSIHVCFNILFYFFNFTLYDKILCFIMFIFHRGDGFLLQILNLRCKRKPWKWPKWWQRFLGVNDVNINILPWKIWKGNKENLNGLRS